MKKLYFSTLSIIFGLGLNAQITITQANHAPTNGEQYGMYQCDSSLVPGAGGAGASWNYTPTGLNALNNYTASSGSYTNFGTADMAVYSSTSNIAYYKASATELNYWGGNINLGAISANLTYSSPAVYAAYPMTLTTSSVSSTGGTVVIPGLGSPGTFIGTCTVTADGTGTMVLPSKTFDNTIRVMTSQIMNFTVGVFTGSVAQIQYDYYSLTDSKYPMLSLIQNTINSQAGNSAQKYAMVQKDYQLVGVQELLSQDVALSVYPNPATSQINFVSGDLKAAAVSVFDVNGRLVDKFALSNGKFSLNVSDYKNGIYIYKLNSSDSQVLKTGKFTVTH